MQLSVSGLKVASALARVAPAGVARDLTTRIGRVAAARSDEQRLVVEANLRRVYDWTGESVDDVELTRRAEQVFEHYANYWLESLRVPHLSLDEVDRRFSYEGLEHVVTPAREGRSVVMALPHLGGWEWAGRWLMQVQELPLAVAVERLEPPELYEWFLRYRRDELGMQVVPVGSGAASELATALLSNSTLALLCDRDVTGDGVEVDFFGAPTRLPGGPAVLALRAERPLVPVGVFVEDGHHHAVILPPLDTERRGRLRADVQRVTQDLAHALEQLIARDPVQWHMLVPAWPDLAAPASHAIGSSTPG